MGIRASLNIAAFYLQPALSLHIVRGRYLDRWSLSGQQGWMGRICWHILIGHGTRCLGNMNRIFSCRVWNEPWKPQDR